MKAAERYVVFIKPFSVTNHETYQGYKEQVTINKGCALPIRETGVFKKVLKVFLPYKMFDSTYSDITKRVTYERLVKEGYIDKRIFTQDDIAGNKLGIATNKWTSSMGSSF